MSLSMDDLKDVTGDAIATGMSALAFVCQPETWPVFAAWAQKIAASDGGPDVAWGEDDRRVYLTFIPLLAEMAKELGAL